MKKILILLVILIARCGYSQNCECTLYQFEEYKLPPMDTFNFRNGEKLRVCPPVKYAFDNDIHDYFKDFTIEDCKNDSLVGYWEHLYCKAEFDGDTLSIIETVKLPIGRKRKLEIVTKSITKLFFENEKIIISHREIPIRKYDQIEIKAVLNDYNYALKGKRISTEKLYRSLLMAALSGNIIAKEYFLSFDSDFLGAVNPHLESYYDLKHEFFPNE